MLGLLTSSSSSSQKGCHMGPHHHCRGGCCAGSSCIVVLVQGVTRGLLTLFVLVVAGGLSHGPCCRCEGDVA